MNHLKTGNSYFAQGSYKSNKYNGKELQETGMYSYGWREYMPDIARWNGIDQLAESYVSASPYAYVMNNPINMFDPDGKVSQAFIDELLDAPPGTTWTNTGNGFTNNWGGQMDYDGNPINYKGYTNMVYGVIAIPNISLKGKGTASTWNKEGNYFPNVKAMMDGFSMAADLLKGRIENEAYRESMRWVSSDRGIDMIGGAGDPIGLFDVAGQIMSNWKPQNRYLAMMAGILGAVALKKPGIATAEIQAEKNLALGLGDDLFTFAEKNSFHTYRDFSTGFNQSKILDAMNSYDKIHFNTTGFGKVNFSRFDPTAPLSYKNYTNWEMHTIINNPSLLKKTVFYRKATDGSYQILDSYSPSF
jgi:RHS repeat-associated protein